MTRTPPAISQPEPPPPGSRRRLFRTLAGLFAPIILIWFAAATVVARGLRFPPVLPYSTKRPLPRGGPAAPMAALRTLVGAPSQEITLGSRGDVRLRGLLVPAANAHAAVVLVCPNQGSPQDLAAYFRVIHAAGYSTLILEYTGQANQGAGFGWEERVDVVVASAALRLRGVEAVAVLGVSQGAAAALFGGARGAPVAAIISDSSYAKLGDFLRRIPPLDSLNPVFGKTVLWEVGLLTGRPVRRIEPVRAAARLGGRPLMVIGGAEDPLAPPSDARQIFDAARGPKELWIVPGAGHAAALATDPEQYARRVTAFLSHYMGTPAPPAKVD